MVDVLRQKDACKFRVKSHATRQVYEALGIFFRFGFFRLTFRVANTLVQRWDRGRGGQVAYKTLVRSHSDA